MVKKPGVPLLKNWIKRKEPQPTPPQKTRLKPAKKEAERQVFVWDETSPEEGLEDTPVAVAQPVVPISNIESADFKTAALGDKAESLSVRTANEAIKSQPVERRASAKRHRKFALASTTRSAAARISGLFAVTRKKSKGHSAALEFAESRRRVGRKGRRNRRILVYAGSCLAVAAILLLVFLVPGGAAAPAGADTTHKVALETASGVSDSAGTTDSFSETGSPIKTSAIATKAPTPTVTPSSTPVPTTEPDPTEQPIDIDELVEYFKVEADLYYNEVGYSSNQLKNYTEDDVYILAQLIYGEARGESTTGKIAVANVVMNRVLCRGKFGSTIKEVVTAPSQFSGYKSTIKPSRSCISAARQVLKNEVWVVPQDVYYFRAVSRYSNLEGQNWGSHSFYKKIGGHYFYRHKYYGRSRGAGVPPAKYDRTYKYPQYGCKPENRVYRVQYMLHELGYETEVDKYFGKGTKEAVIEFQKDHGLKQDGVAGPSTLKKLIDTYGIRKYYTKFCV